MEYLNPLKVYVSVCAEFSDGRLTPLSFVWEDGKRYNVDWVLDVRPAASLKAGGLGIRYTCLVCGKQVNLYREEDLWFMERNGS